MRTLQNSVLALLLVWASLALTACASQPRSAETPEVPKPQPVSVEIPACAPIEGLIQSQDGQSSSDDPYAELKPFTEFADTARQEAYAAMFHVFREYIIRQCMSQGCGIHLPERENLEAIIENKRAGK